MEGSVFSDGADGIAEAAGGRGGGEVMVWVLGTGDMQECFQVIQILAKRGPTWYNSNTHLNI